MPNAGGVVSNIRCCIAVGLVFVATSAVAQWELYPTVSNIEGYTNFLGQGLSFTDFNLDGWDDLTVPNASDELDFHLGGPNGFTEVDLGITVSTGRPTSVMWIDIDNDGDRDFLHTSAMSVSASGVSQTSRSQVWINEEGAFVDRTEEWGWGVLEDQACMGMAFCDVDTDGDLEVVVSNYAMPCTNLWLAENAFFEHVGDSLVDRSVESGIADGFQPSFQSVWMHLDGDSLVDLLVINDAGVGGGCEDVLTPVNEAYVQQSDGTFLKSSEALGANISMSSMTASVGDPDADGQEEVFITNTGDVPFSTHELTESAFMDRNTSGIFEERGSEVGLDLNRWSWSAAWVDADLDGWEDLMVATYPFHMPGDGQDVEFYDNYWMHHPGASLSDGTGVFVEDTSAWPGRDHPMFSLVRGDIDGDGCPDMVGLGTAQFLTLWHNQANETHPDHHGLTVSVCGSHSNSEAIGTRMVLHSAGVAQMRTLRAGEDLYVQHSTTQFFGLGASLAADSLEIFWPSGVREVHHGLAADTAHQFVEAADEVQVEFGQAQGDSVELHLIAPPKWTEVEWNGTETGGVTHWAVLEEPVSVEVSWFHGLFSVSVDVDWTSYGSVSAGCTIPVADNFDPEATEDDGSCTYQSLCGSGTIWSDEEGQCVSLDTQCPPDVNGDGLVGVADVLLVLTYYGESCDDITD